MYSIPLVPPDVDDEETLERCKESLDVLEKIFNEINSKVMARMESINERVTRIQRRASIIQQKYEVVEKSSEAVTLLTPTTYIGEDYEPTTTVFCAAYGIEFYDNPRSRSFTPRTESRIRFDVKSELDQRKKFFVASTALNEVNRSLKSKVRKARPLPNHLTSTTELFYDGTERLAFDGTSMSDKKKKRSTATSKKSKDGDDVEGLLDQTAIGTELSPDDLDPFAYRPSSVSVKPLELPTSLPNLTGFAENLTLNETLSMMDTFEDELKLDGRISAFSDEAPSNLESDVLSNIPSLASYISSTKEPSTRSDHPEEQPTTSTQPPSIPPPLSSLPPLISPTAPTPPPPPPPPMTTPLTPMSPAMDGGRTDLMAAIRAAGGAGKVPLRKVTDRKQGRSRQKSELGESSLAPLKEEKSSSGGDLMSALARALDSRRKAIVGTNESRNIMPTKGTLDEGVESGDDEWN